METSLGSRLKHAWDVFRNNDSTYINQNFGVSYSYRPDRTRLTRGSERSIINSVYNRIALDVAAIDIRHVRLDDNERYTETLTTGLNECLSVSANVDQTGRALIHDLVLSMLDEGVVALVPVDTTQNINVTGSFDVLSMRVGKIVDWMPQHVRVRLYNEALGKDQEVIVPKNVTAIIENPFYSVMNAHNSTMQRLIRKLALLDGVDDQTCSGKLDMIIQLPYVIKSKSRQQQAEERRKQIEDQLTSSKLGIAYTDGTERIVQLNRPIENNLLKQIEYLTETLYSQLGITVEIMNGSADEKTMLNYNNRVVEPILSAITDEMKRKFLTKTARTQKQSIEFFRDPFKLVPVANIAEIADKFTRNEIMSSNEVRQIVGMKPSDDPKADELRNKNLSEPANGTEPEKPAANDLNVEEGIQNGV